MYGIRLIAVLFVVTLICQRTATLETAPLDINETLSHTLGLVSSLVGIIGGGVSSLVMGLTGISITDCALAFKDVDVSKLTCQQFLDYLSTCDSLSNVKPLLKAAKKKYMKKYPRRASKPCTK